MIGRTYLERGAPVVVLVRWGPPSATGSAACTGCGKITDADGAKSVWFMGCCGGSWVKPKRQGPRNVLIQRADGTKVVRPFRGLRRLPKETRDA